MNGTRVLVVEDEAIVAADIAQFVASLGYATVGPFGNGEEALAHVEREPVDIALMDIHLAGNMDGIETARALLERDVGVIFLTAYADEQTLSRAKLARPYGYVVKPFEERDLRAALKVAVYKRAIEREIAQHRELLAAILDGAGDAIIGLDEAARITFLNSKAESLFGLRADEARGRAASVLHLEGAGAARLDEGLARAVASAQRRRINKGTMIETAEGNRVRVSGVLSPLMSPNGLPRGAVLILRSAEDDTRIASLQAEVSSLRLALAERVRQLI